MFFLITYYTQYFDNILSDYNLLILISLPWSPWRHCSSCPPCSWRWPSPPSPPPPPAPRTRAGGRRGPAATSCPRARSAGTQPGRWDQARRASITGCPISKFPLCFGCFLGFWSTYRGTSDLYSTALEICYTIATRIFKFDLEIAEIFEVKVGTRHFEIDILLLHRVKKIILVSQVPTLTSIISAISESIFKILVAIM